jgi:dCTP deaminase
MIEPFVDGQVRDGKISYGLSSYGYDIRVADEFKIFTNRLYHRWWIPRISTCAPWSIFKGKLCIHSPNSFAWLARVEYFHIPRGVMTLLRGQKNYYARCGIIVNVTLWNRKWEGYATLEISNTTLCRPRYSNGGYCPGAVSGRGWEFAKPRMPIRKGNIMRSRASYCQNCKANTAGALFIVLHVAWLFLRSFNV